MQKYSIPNQNAKNHIIEVWFLIQIVQRFQHKFSIKKYKVPNQYKTDHIIGTWFLIQTYSVPNQYIDDHIMDI